MWTANGVFWKQTLSKPLISGPRIPNVTTDRRRSRLAVAPPPKRKNSPELWKRKNPPCHGDHGSMSRPIVTAFIQNCSKPPRHAIAFAISFKIGKKSLAKCESSSLHKLNRASFQSPDGTRSRFIINHNNQCRPADGFSDQSIMTVLARASSNLGASFWKSSIMLPFDVTFFAKNIDEQYYPNMHVWKYPNIRAVSLVPALSVWRFRLQFRSTS